MNNIRLSVGVLSMKISSCRQRRWREGHRFEKR